MATKPKPQPKPARARAKDIPKSKAAPDSVAKLAPNERNPRKPWEQEQQEAFRRSLTEFGDLSGIVFNLASGQLVGGHKRVDEFRNAKGATLVCEPALKTPDATGTCRYGHVVLPSGARFAYREVDWSEAKEAAANIAANQWGAEWDMSAVTSMLATATEGGFDLDLTGFSAPEVEALLAGDYTLWGEGGTEADAAATPAQESEDDADTAIRYTPDDAKKIVEFFGEGARLTVEASTGQVWRVGDNYLYVGSVLADHATYLPYLDALRTEFPKKKILFVPMPDPLMVGHTDARVSALFVQPAPLAAALALSLIKKGKPKHKLKLVASARA